MSTYLTVTYNGNVIYQNEDEHVAWYDHLSIGDVPPSRVKDNSREDGYQYGAVEFATECKGICYTTKRNAGSRYEFSEKSQFHCYYFNYGISYISPAYDIDNNEFPR